MKRILFSVLFFVIAFSSRTVIAQPSNDECISAIDLDSLPSPGLCTGGIKTGATLTISGSLVGAGASSPYYYQTACSGSSSVMSHPANDVWYKFIATGYQLKIDIASTFVHPNVAVFSDNCPSLGGLARGCAVGNSGSVSLTVEQMLIGKIYYVVVSGDSSENGTFNMDIHNNSDCNNCMISSELIVNPLPINGTYSPGQTVNICYHILEFSQVNTNWLHGVQISFGSGWDLTTLITSPPPTCQTAPVGGVWIYSPIPVISSAMSSWPAGFYFDADNDGNPGNNFGDNCDVAIDSSKWNFCFSITTLADSNLTIVFNTSGDGESGSWTSSACTGDPAYVFQVSGMDNTTTNISESVLADNVIIYPNPFSSSATVKINSQVKRQNTQMVISDIYGTVVKQIMINGNQASIERSTLVNGIYFYKLINNKELIGNGKFIIK